MKITFLPAGVSCEISSNETVLHAARQAGIYINAYCGAKGACGKCKIKLALGKLSEVSPVEKSALSHEELANGIRLACRARAQSDVSVEIPGNKQEKILTESIAGAGEIMPGEQKGYGVAIDVGTTTLAVYLCNLESGETVLSACGLNPQIPFGADVLSRVAYCMEKETGLSELRGVLFAELNRLISILAKDAGLKTEEILEAVIVGNTVMHHIAAGINPGSIGVAPYSPVIKDSFDMPAQGLGLAVSPEGNVHFLPTPAGFVGADAVAAILATEPYKSGKTTLLIDIGTNSEICLAHLGEIYVTSCATGPALEGAQIRWGSRAEAGAIEKVKIDPVTLEAQIEVIGNTDEVTGICGSGIVDAAAQMAEAGIIEPNGRFSPNIVSSRIRRDSGAEYVLHFGKNVISVTQKDIRAVQLAKAALYAGAVMLMKQVGVSSVDEIILAGAFGTYLDKENALKLGMFPDCLLKNIRSVGNAAGLGARMALINKAKRLEAGALSQKAVFIETAALGEYPAAFARAMHIPHERDVFGANHPYIWHCGADGGHASGAGTIRLIERTNEYPYGKISELDREIVCSAIRMAEDVPEGIIEIPGPFSLIASLVNPQNIYTEMKNPALKELLDAAADAIAGFVSKHAEEGRPVFSLADAEGVTELVGKKWFAEVSGAAVLGLLKKIEPYMTGSVTYICGKLSYSLQNAGMVAAKPYRFEDGLTYEDMILQCAKRKDFRFIGHGCIHKLPTCPIVYKLELGR